MIDLWKGDSEDFRRLGESGDVDAVGPLLVLDTQNLAGRLFGPRTSAERLGTPSESSAKSGNTIKQEALEAAEKALLGLRAPGLVEALAEGLGKKSPLAAEALGRLGDS